MCIFVCFTSKAIHIELVGDMTTSNFIAALKRFFARRGKPTDIYCDNGSNFVGACNEIKKFFELNSSTVSENFASDQIKFHFLPPQAPHFGGLHEAGVKSVKHHLRRVLGLSHLTYEDLYTTLTQIEAILNSRPLTPLSLDPNDYLPLTPSHFLIGRSMTSIPEADHTSTNTLRLNNYQKIQQLRQHFWTRWQQEYISELQLRTKWKQSQGSLQPGNLVVIKDKQLPPLKWLLGRIIAVYPGKDSSVRVAEIKTASGVLKRDFSKICPLPVDVKIEDVEDDVRPPPVDSPLEDDTSRAGSMSQTTPILATLTARGARGRRVAPRPARDR